MKPNMDDIFDSRAEEFERCYQLDCKHNNKNPDDPETFRFYMFILICMMDARQAELAQYLKDKK